MGRATGRPLNTTQLPRMASDLRALADLLDRGDAILMQRLFADIADNGYPSRASGAFSNGAGGGELTPVEAKASRRDKAAETAHAILDTQMDVWAGIRYLLHQYANHRPDRPTTLWPCGHIKDGRYRRCQECGAGATPRSCDNCRRSLGAGEKLRRAIALDQEGRELMECHTCWQWRVRHGGATRPTNDGISLRDGLMVGGATVTGS